MDGDAEDLAGGCGSEVGDVEVSVGSEGHACGDGESGGDVFDVAVVVEADDFAVAGGGVSGGVGDLECVEESVGSEVDRDDGGESGAGAGEAELLDVVAAAEAEEEGPGAGFGVEAHDLAGVGGDGKEAEVADVELAVVGGDGGGDDVALLFGDVELFAEVSGRGGGEELSVVGLDGVEAVVVGDEGVEDAGGIEVTGVGVCGGVGLDELAEVGDGFPGAGFGVDAGDDVG